jgi:thioredoxin-like negative regulator of GroEL
MTSLLFLNTNDFTKVTSPSGPLLVTGIKGFSLVLFYSTLCKHCKRTVPEFQALPKILGGCHFGMINVSTNKGIVKKSMDTNTNISYVPYVVLYINGKPFMRYEGPKTKEMMRKFVIDVSKSLDVQQINEGGSKEKSYKARRRNMELEKLTTGTPLYGEEDHYFISEMAYGK